MIKTVQAPHLGPGRAVKLGRTRAVARHPRLSLASYLRLDKLPAAPTTSDYRSAAMSALRNVYLNDQLGDCVIAGGYHVVATETGNADGGTPFVATDAQILADYSAIGGYVQGNPSTDQGCNESDALNYWAETGFANGTKILGSAYVDATNWAEVQAAMWLFEHLFFGFELPDTWINPMPSGDNFVWDAAAPDPKNGHAVIGVGHDATKGILIDTWGMFGWLTPAAVAALAVPSAGGELHVLLSPDMILKGQAKAPNGVAWADLLADFAAIGGVVPPPPAPPAPAPATPTVSLAQAQEWAVQGLAQHWPVGQAT